MRNAGLLSHGDESPTLPALSATDRKSCGGDDAGEDNVGGDDHFYLWLGAENLGTSKPAPL